MMFGVLDRYIGRTVLNAILVTLFLLVSLSGIIKFVDQLRAVGNGNYTTWMAGLYSLLGIPGDIEIFFPMAALLGVLIGLGTLATRSELVVMQASGFTKIQIAIAVMKTAIPLMLLTMAIGEWLAPKGEQKARSLKTEMIYGGTVLINKGQLWVKERNDFIHIQQIINENGDNELRGINIYRFDPQRRLQSILYAANGHFDNEKKQWQLSQVEESVLGNTENITGTQRLTGTWQTSLTPDKLSVAVVKSEALSISDLYAYIQYLQTTGQETKGYLLNFWKKLFAPFSLMVMMLLALSFIFGPLRSVPTGVRMVTGITFGFVFFLLNEVFAKLSLVSGMPPLLSTLLPSLLFLVLSVYLLSKRG